MKKNPSDRFKSIDFSRVVPFDYVFSAPSNQTPTDPLLLSMTSLSQIKNNPSTFIDNCNIHNPSLYKQEYSQLKNCVIVCLSKIAQDSVFEKISSLSRDTGNF